MADFSLHDDLVRDHGRYVERFMLMRDERTAKASRKSFAKTGRSDPYFPDTFPQGVLREKVGAEMDGALLQLDGLAGTHAGHVLGSFGVARQDG